MKNSVDRTVLRGMEEMLFTLVTSEATPKQWTEWLRAPLEHAVSKGDLDLTRVLLKAGASGKAGWRGCGGRTLLDAAVKGGNEEVVSALLDAGARGDLNSMSRGQTMPPVHRAIAGGNTALARVLMMAGGRVDASDTSGRNALHHAVAGRHKALVQDVLIAQPDIDRYDTAGETPLHIAVASRDYAIVSMLLRSGASVEKVDRDGRRAIDRVVESTNTLTPVKSQGGADSDGCLAPPESKVPAIINLLIQYGSEVDPCDMAGTTPLHRAVLTGEVDVIDALVEAGANIEVTLYRPTHLKGQTPLHRAAFSRNILTMAALLRHGADIDAEAFDQRTPLHIACEQSSEQGSVEAVDFLLRQGADETALDDHFKGRIRSDGPSADSIKRLLRSAPADRVWRRRATLVLYRTFPDKLKRNFRVTTEGEPAKVPCQGKGIGADAGTSRRDENERLFLRVVEVEAEAIFRKIVGFL